MILIYLSIIFTLLGFGVLIFGFFKKPSFKKEELEPFVPPREVPDVSAEKSFEKDVDGVSRSHFYPSGAKREVLSKLSFESESKEKIASLLQDLELERKKTEELAAECKKTKEENAALKLELSSLKNKLEALEKDKQMQEEKLNKTIEGASQLPLQLKKKEEELALLERDNQTLVLKVKDWQARSVELEKEIVRLKNLLEELNSKTILKEEAVSKQQWLELSKRLETSENALKDSRENERRLVLKLEEMSRELTQKSQLVDNSQQKIDSLINEIESLKQKLILGEEEKNRIKEELERRHEEANTMIASLQKKEAESVELRKECQELLQKNKMMQEKISQLENELLQLKGSLSASMAEGMIDKSHADSASRENIDDSTSQPLKEQEKIKELNERLEVFKEQYSNRVKEYEEQVNSLKEKLAILEIQNSQLQNELKEKSAELVNLQQLNYSKSDLINNLKNKLGGKDSENINQLISLQEELIKARNKISELENTIKSNKDSHTLSYDKQSVDINEYNSLKQRLDSLENLLRLIHGES